MSDHSRSLAVLRIGLGLAQIMGATALVVFWLKTGVSTVTSVTAVLTLACTLASRLIFSRNPDVEEPHHDGRS